MKIYVDTEESIIQTIIDITNITKPKSKRISDTEYTYFEGLMHCQRQLGTINSVAADTFVKAFVEKPDMKRRSFLNYRNSLVEKGWLKETDKKQIMLLDGLNLHGVTFRQAGSIGCIPIERIEYDLEGKDSTQQE